MQEVGFREYKKFGADSKIVGDGENFAIGEKKLWLRRSAAAARLD